MSKKELIAAICELSADAGNELLDTACEELNENDVFFAQNLQNVHQGHVGVSVTPIRRWDEDNESCKGWVECAEAEAEAVVLGDGTDHHWTEEFNPKESWVIHLNDPAALENAKAWLDVVLAGPCIYDSEEDE